MDDHVFSQLSPEARAIVGAGHDRLDQVDIVLILDRHAPRLDADIELVTGHQITRLPPSIDPCDIDWWVVSPESPTMRPGTSVRQLVSHGHSYEELDLLQTQGHLQLAPPRIRHAMSFDEASQWWDDYLLRHPDLTSIDTWRVATLTPPATAQRRLAAHAVRVGQTVQQLITRGLSYGFIDNAQREGWLTLAPQS